MKLQLLHTTIFAISAGFAVASLGTDPNAADRVNKSFGCEVTKHCADPAQNLLQIDSCTIAFGKLFPGVKLPTTLPRLGVQRVQCTVSEVSQRST